MPESFKEAGVFNKPWKSRVKIALVYPNSYEVGMSSLGFQSLYRILNEKSFITAERVFLNREGVPLSVESSHKLNDFDFIFFSISYSADIINVFEILKRSSIKLQRSERRSKGPVLCAGGTGIYSNPEPLGDVLDFFFLGEGESFIERFCTLLDDNPGTVKNKTELLEAIENWDGIYIPKNNVKKTKVKRVHEKKIDDFPTYSSLFTDRSEFGTIFMEEISRGCSRGCRFCSIGFSARPFRTRKPSSLMFGQKNPGYKVGLVGAGICDHPEIKSIGKGILSNNLGISFSSFRADKIDEDITELIKLSRIKSFAIAPEAGSERLRQIINKNLSDGDILNGAEKLSRAGVSILKLYFMIGLPFERESDIESIIRLCERIALVFKGKRIKVSINPFVPKPFTPFQWFGMDRPKNLKSKFKFIKNEIGSKRITLEPLNLNKALLDAVFSKSDRNFVSEIIGLFGKEIDQREEIVRMAKDDNCFIYNNLQRDAELPWDFIDMGITKDFLLSEYNKAVELSRNP